MKCFVPCTRLPVRTAQETGTQKRRNKQGVGASNAGPEIITYCAYTRVWHFALLPNCNLLAIGGVYFRSRSATTMRYTHARAQERQGLYASPGGGCPLVCLSPLPLSTSFRSLLCTLAKIMNARTHKYLTVSGGARPSDIFGGSTPERPFSGAAQVSRDGRCWVVL